MKRLPSLSRVAAALLCCLAAACSAPPPAPQAAAFLVQVVTVKPVDYSTEIALTGNVEARDELALAFRTSGRISARLVDVGDHVVPGQTVAKLDPEQQQAELNAANAAVTAAQAQVQQASQTLDRQQALLSQGVTTRAQVDQAKAAYQQAQSSLQSAQSGVGTAQESLGYTELKSTVAGVVISRNNDVGEVAAAGQPVFTIAVDGPRDAVFDVQEAAFLQRPDPNSVRVSLVSDPHVTASGRIREIAPTLSSDTGTVRVKVAIDNPPAAMAIGAAVTGSVRTMAQPSIVLPAGALWSDESGPAVWIVDPATHQVSLHPIGIASFTADSVVVGSGLKQGDIVVAAGGKLLHPGQTVSTEPAP